MLALEGAPPLELRLLPAHETVEAALQDRVVGREVTLPRPVALLEAKAVHREHPERPKTVRDTRAPHRLEDLRGVGDRAVDLPAELPDVGDPEQQHLGSGEPAPLPVEPGTGEVGVAHRREDVARARSGEDLAAVGLGPVLDRDGRAGREVAKEPVPVVPLRRRRGDEQHLVVAEPRHRHLRHDAAAIVREVDETDAPDPRKRAGDEGPEPVRRARTAHVEPAEPREVEDARSIAHREALLADAGEPGTFPGPGLRGRLRGVVPGQCEPVRALPAAVGSELPPQLPDAVMHRREPLVAPGRPGVVGEVHRVLVAVDLPRLRKGVVLIGMVHEPAGVAAPHVPFGTAVGHPLRKHLAGAPRLRDPEGEDARLEGVRDPGHRPDERVAVRGVGNRAVDDAAHPALAEQGHPGDRVLHVPLEPFEVVGIELEGEVLGHRIVRGHPVGAAAALVGAEVQPELLLAEIPGRVHVPEQGEPAARLPAPRLELGDRFGEEVLVRHGHHRNAAPEHRADLAPPVAGRVHDVLATHLPLRSRDHPLAAVPANARHGTESDHPGAEVARALREGLGELGRIDISVAGVVERTGEIVGLEEGVAIPQLLRRADPHVHALVAAHPHHPLELHHALVGMGEADGPGDVVVHGVVDFVGEPSVELRRVALHVHDRPARREGRHVAGRVPRRARGELVLLEEKAVRPPLLREVKETRGADRAAPDDDRPRDAR